MHAMGIERDNEVKKVNECNQLQVYRAKYIPYVKNLDSYSLLTRVISVTNGNPIVTH